MNKNRVFSTCIQFLHPSVITSSGVDLISQKACIYWWFFPCCPLQLYYSDCKSFFHGLCHSFGIDPSECGWYVECYHFWSIALVKDTRIHIWSFTPCTEYFSQSIVSLSPLRISSIELQVNEYELAIVLLAIASIVSPRGFKCHWIDPEIGEKADLLPVFIIRSILASRIKWLNIDIRIRFEYCCWLGDRQVLPLYTRTIDRLSHYIRSERWSSR